MVAPYCPDRGDIIWIDFDPQSGREMMKRCPALVLSVRAFNHMSGLCVLCPITSKAKGRAYEVSLQALEVPSVVLSGNLCSYDWRTRKAQFIAKAPASVLGETVENIAALIGVE